MKPVDISYDYKYNNILCVLLASYFYVYLNEV
mgnify:CR=1 FL=1|jgi:hypothetical protein